MVLAMTMLMSCGPHLSVLALSSRFDGRILGKTAEGAYTTFSTRSVESF